VAAIPTGSPQRDQRFAHLGGQQTPLPLFASNLGMDHLCRSHLTKQLDHQRHSGMRGNEGRSNSVINLERQSSG